MNMDGNGTDRSYLAAHRALDLSGRHVVEDPVFHDSRGSQFVQMADLVAYSAFMHLNRHDGNRFAWSWFDDHFATSGGAMIDLKGLSAEKGKTR
ncbi:hypothetical protein C5B96_14800 [Subtercola sp. Z020]|nr:hypothetical protein C5B96_14800 [Subtercola sp. Z020]